MARSDGMLERSDIVGALVRRTLRLPRRWSAYRRALHAARGSHLAIVMYHGVTDIPLSPFNWSQLPLDSFARQIQFIADEYTVLPLGEVAARVSSGSELPRRTAVITFDDAFRNVLTTALPVLERHRLPATVFVVTGLPERGQPAWPDQVYQALATTPEPSVQFGSVTWPLRSPAERSAAHLAIVARLKRMGTSDREAQTATLFSQAGTSGDVPPASPLATMSWSEIAQLTKSGLIGVGSHTHTHPILSRCDLDRQATELRLSRDILRERVGPGAGELLAYPNGTRADFTDDTVRLAQAAGYRCAVSTMPGLNRRDADLYTLRRVNVDSEISMTDFEIAMAGF